MWENLLMMLLNWPGEDRSGSKAVLASVLGVILVAAVVLGVVVLIDP